MTRNVSTQWLLQVDERRDSDDRLLRQQIETIDLVAIVEHAAPSAKGRTRLASISVSGTQAMHDLQVCAWKSRWLCDPTTRSLVVVEYHNRLPLETKVERAGKSDRATPDDDDRVAHGRAGRP